MLAAGLKKVASLVIPCVKSMTSMTIRGLRLRTKEHDCHFKILISSLGFLVCALFGASTPGPLLAFHQCYALRSRGSPERNWPNPAAPWNSFVTLYDTHRTWRNIICYTKSKCYCIISTCFQPASSKTLSQRGCATAAWTWSAKAPMDVLWSTASILLAACCVARKSTSTSCGHQEMTRKCRHRTWR